MTPNLVMDVIVRPYYRVGYEQHGSDTFVHVIVDRWTPAIARQFKLDIDAAQALLGSPVYALYRPEAANQTKFLEMHSFTPCGEAFDASGRVVPIYVRTLDGKPSRRPKCAVSHYAERQPD